MEVCMIHTQLRCKTRIVIMMTVSGEYIVAICHLTTFMIYNVNESTIFRHDNASIGIFFSLLDFTMCNLADKMFMTND